MGTFTEELADYALRLAAGRRDDGADAEAKKLIKNCYGCILAGAHEPVTMLAHDCICLPGGKRTATVIGMTGFKTSAGSAAAINAIAARARNYDDISITTGGHPSAAVLPAVLAVGEELRVSGAQAIRAYIVGMQVNAAVEQAMGDGKIWDRWSATGLAGIFGAGAAAGTLWRLGRDQLVHAFGLAAGLVCGLSASLGTAGEYLQAGMAAGNGVMAVRMARLGYTSARDIVEQEDGLLEALGVCRERGRPGGQTGGQPEQIDGWPGQTGGQSEQTGGQPGHFPDSNLRIKKYPSSYVTHAAIDAAIRLQRNHSLAVREIESVVIRYRNPVRGSRRDPLRDAGQSFGVPAEGRCNISYCTACALIYGRVSMEHFEGTQTWSDGMVKLMNRIELRPCADGDGALQTAHIEVRLRDGRSFGASAGAEFHVRTEEELDGKFLDCISKSVRVKEADGLIRCLDHLEKLEDIRMLTAQTEQILY